MKIKFAEICHIECSLWNSIIIWCWTSGIVNQGNCFGIVFFCGCLWKWRLEPDQIIWNIGCFICLFSPHRPWSYPHTKNLRISCQHALRILFWHTLQKWGLSSHEDLTKCASFIKISSFWRQIHTNPEPKMAEQRYLRCLCSDVVPNYTNFYFSRTQGKSKTQG